MRQYRDRLGNLYGNIDLSRALHCMMRWNKIEVSHVCQVCCMKCHIPQCGWVSINKSSHLIILHMWYTNSIQRLVWSGLVWSILYQILYWWNKKSPCWLITPCLSRKHPQWNAWVLDRKFSYIIRFGKCGFSRPPRVLVYRSPTFSSSTAYFALSTEKRKIWGTRWYTYNIVLFLVRFIQHSTLPCKVYAQMSIWLIQCVKRVYIKSVPCIMQHQCSIMQPQKK